MRWLSITALLVGCGGGSTLPEPAAPVPDGGTTTGGGTWQPDSHGGDDTDAGTGEADTWTPPPCTVGVPCNDGQQCTIDDTCLQQADGAFCRGTEYVCDDGRECTADECDGEGGCEQPIKDGWCLLNNTCIPHGTVSGTNACERCDSDGSKIGWSEIADDAGCEDGDPCTFGDYCKKGECVRGLNAVCDDGNQCTADACDKTKGCVHAPASGACDDGNPCTNNSMCSGGVCHSPSGACDDGNQCTTDTCLPDLGCAFVETGGPCEDGDACTSQDGCEAGTCVPGPPTDCSDGTQCTVDECDSVFGCFQTLTGDPCCAGAVHVCDDGDPCTVDGCGAEGGCTHTTSDGPCDDGDQCTVGDVCIGGQCIAGAASACDDGNPCSSDLCDPSGGCQHVPLIGPCNDGIECTTGDECLDGECKGDASECECEPDFAPTVVKATLLQLGTKGTPGQGLDVDLNPNTCTPSNNCSGGIDNTLSVLHSIVNENLEYEVNAGGLVLLFELMNPTTDGSEFELRLYPGKKADWGCDHTQAGCPYVIDDAGLNEDCGPLVSIPATISNGKLSAGGPGSSFFLSIPLFGNTYLAVQLYDGAVTGDVSLSGNDVTITNGVVGGAVPKAVFISALELVPDGQLPAPKETIAQLLDVLVTEDIDTGPPAGPDAASIGLRFEAVGGTIVGVD